MQEKIEGRFLGLIPLLIFIVIYLGAGIFFQMQGVEKAFYQFPAPIAMLFGVFTAFILFKGKIEEKFKVFLEGCGNRDIMTMCLIYLLAGAFATVTKKIGGVDSTVNLGLTFIPTQFLSAGLFIIASFVSTATGTSVGAIVSLAPIAVGLAQKGGISTPLILAALMSGAMFGDNLSIISDTTIASTGTQNVEMKAKLKVNSKVAIPAGIISIILFIILGNTGSTNVIIEKHDYQLIKLLPYICVFVFSILEFNVFSILASGIVVSSVIGLFMGTFTPIQLCNEIYNGFTGMTDIFLLSLFTGGIGALITKAGGIQWIVDWVQKHIVGPKSAQLGIGALVSIADLAVANNTVAILLIGPIAKKISEKYNLSPKNVAAILDIFSCIFQGIIPYGAQMLILLEATSGSVSPIQVIPLLWYQFLLGLFTIVFIIMRKQEDNFPVGACDEELV